MYSPDELDNLRREAQEDGDDFFDDEGGDDEYIPFLGTSEYGQMFYFNDQFHMCHCYHQSRHAFAMPDA